MKPGSELDRMVHKALGLWPKDALVMAALDVPAYSTDIAAAWAATENFFKGGEAIGLGQDIDGRWIASFSKWTNGGEYGPRIWDDTSFSQTFKGLTAPHAISLVVAGYFEANGEPDCPFHEWGYDVMEDSLRFYDDSAEPPVEG